MVRVYIVTSQYSIHARIHPGILARGGVQVCLTKKALTTFFIFFIFFFFSPQLILQKLNGQFQRNLSFSRFQRGSNIFHFPGGFQLFPGGGSNCLFSIETHITCEFPRGGGGVRTLCPPLWIHTCHFINSVGCTC